jgi:RND family efflux transporter MFP subunit
MMPTRNSRAQWMSYLSGLLCMLIGCDRSGPPPGPPPPAVTVTWPLEKEVIEWDEYTGRLDAVESVEVRARVSGLIESAPFQEGTNVKKGDLLFTIDARPYQADLDKAQAQIAAAEAQIRYWQAETDRLAALKTQGAGSDIEFLQARQNLESNQAARASAIAATEAARLNVEWCRVTAPIDGRISNKVVTPGNLVNGGAGQATLLTTVVSQDPIYCYINADEASVLKYAELAREGKRVSARYAKIPTFMSVASETGFPHEGVVDFVDNRIDPNTGTVRGRGVFPNSDGFLQPGMFARVRIPGSGRYTALLIPDVAVGADQNRRFVLVVNADDTVAMHPVKLGALFGDLRAIESGITKNDRVIVNGLQRARPGAKVSPTEQPIPADALTLTAPGSPTTQALPATRTTTTTAPATAPTGGSR